MNTRRISAVMMLALLPVWSLSACAGESKVKVREPLTLSPSAQPTAQQYTSQGSSAYLTGQYDQAKSLFAQAVSAAPNSGEAHYNLGLALFKLGDTEAAREQFMQAANLSPGNKIIWDSPALSPYSSPDANLPKKIKEHPYANSKPTFGGGPR
ncbi:MAG: tetratricopeptide repeat protein [Nitrospirae bacterium]|nr:tetratricopeptide repeat protein [Nitrospirota bacterium]